MNDIDKAMQTSFAKFQQRLKNGGDLPREKQPMSDEYKAYIEKVNTPTIHTPTREEVVKNIWYKLNARANDNKFVPTVNQKELMNYLFEYFSRGQKKGICLIGNYGAGKTEIMKAFSTTRFYPYDYLKSGKICHLTSAIEMVDYYNSDNNFDKFFENNLYIDDFGAEQRAKYMAKGEDPVLSKFLELWYIRCRDSSLFITTNLSRDELKEKYGARVFSRMEGMMEFIELNGLDFRKL
jgi:DNA replication protein DnaC